MSSGLTRSNLKGMTIEQLVRRAEGRLDALLADHRLGDPWPTITVPDYCYLMELVIRISRARLEEHEP